MDLQRTDAKDPKHGELAKVMAQKRIDFVVLAREEVQRETRNLTQRNGKPALTER
jgi:hypothetical protein